MADTCRWICQEWTISTLPPLSTAHCAKCWSEVPGPRGLGREGLRHLRARWDEWGSSQGCSHRRMHWGDSRGKLGSFCLFLRTPDSFIHPSFPSISSFHPHLSSFPTLYSLLDFFHQTPSPPPQSLMLPYRSGLYGNRWVLLAQMGSACTMPTTLHFLCPLTSNP